jgi:hypothetical protein
MITNVIRSRRSPAVRPFASLRAGYKRPLRTFPMRALADDQRPTTNGELL